MDKGATTETSATTIPTRTLIFGYVTCNVLYAFISVATWSVLIGPFLYPKIFGLYVLVPYYTATLFLKRDELHDGSHWHCFSQNNTCLRYIREYLQLKILKPPPKELTDLDNSDGGQVILGVFPHGSFADYRILLDGMMHEVMPTMSKKTATLAASALFRVPIARELGLWTGCIDARRSVAEKALKKGRSLLIIPGGETEQILCTKGKEIIYVQKRKGFIKLAMRHKVPVAPVYVFGASDYYDTSHAFFGFRSWLVKKLGVAIPLTMGQWGSMFCPKPVPTTVVFGKPLTFSMKIPGEPTDEEVVQAHSQFIKALQALFDDNKKKLGYGDRNLEIL